MKIRLYMDEDSMDQAVVRALRARAVDVTTAWDEDMPPSIELGGTVLNAAVAFRDRLPIPVEAGSEKSQEILLVGEIWRTRLSEEENGVMKSG